MLFASQIYKYTTSKATFIYSLPNNLSKINQGMSSRVFLLKNKLQRLYQIVGIQKIRESFINKTFQSSFQN